MVVGAVVGVAGTIASASASRKAAKAQERQQALATQRSRRQAIREAQALRARTMNMAAGMNAQGSSAVQGGLSALSSQVGSELGFSTQMSGLSRQISRLSTRADTFGAAAGLGFRAFQWGASRQQQGA
jgi:hypothetical protein